MVHVFLLLLHPSQHLLFFLLELLQTLGQPVRDELLLLFSFV
jgi:hypothetical protein